MVEQAGYPLEPTRAAVEEAVVCREARPAGAMAGEESAAATAALLVATPEG